MFKKLENKVLYKNKNLCKVRTVTTFLTLQKDKSTWENEILKASVFCNDLAVTEDSGLAQGTIKGEFDIRSLLTYSSVCGIGLDTVPIPGDTSIEKLNALMRDTGTMAFRLNKPLTVRVFPVPDLKAGDMTVYESDDLCNCKILEVR